MVLLNLEYCSVLTFLVLQIWDNGCEANGYTIFAPEEVTAQVGLCVHIPCRYTVPYFVTISNNAKGFWYRPESFRELVASNDDRPRRMFFTGEVPKRDCSLFINDVQESDDNTYQFRLEDNEKYSYYNIKPRLRVTGLTDKPEISVRKLIAGEKATITCKSPGVCAGSAPDITWEGIYGNTLFFTNPYPNLTSIYFSNFTFTPSKSDNGSPLVCRASFLRNMASTQQTINLIVEYPPDVSITAGDTTLIVIEGDNKTLTCWVDSNPIAEITWFVGDKVIKGPTTGPKLTYDLQNIGPHNAGKYLCYGDNDHGNSTGTLDIIVHYAPRTPNIMCPTINDCTIDSQHTIYVMENSTFSLLCTAESLPEASVSWVTLGSNQTRVKGNLTLYDISLGNGGEFTCEASNIYGKSTAAVNIKVTYKPRTVLGKNSDCWNHGGVMECACIIQSFPPANIQWNIDEKFYPSNHSDKEFHIVTVTLNALTNSTLTVTAGRTNIRAIQCMTSNKHGKLDLLLFSNAHSDSTVMIVATSCVVAIVLLLVGGFLVSRYFRKKKTLSNKQDKKEIVPEDSSVIYSNSQVHLYGNQTTENGANPGYSIQDDKDVSVYMNVEDTHYAAINFSKMKLHKPPEDIEVEYAEIRK